MRLLLYFLMVLLILPSQAYAAFDSAEINSNKKPLKIIRVTPAGSEVPASRQIIFSFNRPVVPIGEMARERGDLPITIQPELACEWRWLNTTSLACQLGQKQAMKAATKYTINVSPSIRAEDGTTLDHQYNFKFLTKRPAVQRHYFVTWKSPGHPIIKVIFNQEVKSDLLHRSFRFVLADGTSVAANLVKPDDKTPIGDGRRFQLTPQQELPHDSTIKLQIQPGIQSVHGKLKGIEHRTIVQFDTFPEFRFLGLECRSNSGEPLKFQRDQHAGACNPMGWQAMLFSAPVIRDEIKKNFTLTPDLAGGRTDYDPWARLYAHSRLSGSYKKGRVYRVRLPENLKAAQQYQLELQKSLKDEFGRSLPEAVAFPFQTDHRPPNYSFEHHISVLEKDVASHLPIVVTNMQQLTIDYSIQNTDETLKGQQHTIHLPKVVDVAYRHPMKLRHLLSGKSGVIRGSFDTVPDIHHSKHREFIFSQITPYNVHVKSGHFNTIVWVTDMRSGKPVHHANVEVYVDQIKHGTVSSPILSQAMTNKDGIALLAGSEILDPENELRRNYAEAPELFVRVQKGEDMALLPMDHQFYAYPQGSAGEYIPNSSKNKFGHVRSWGTTAQGIYKAGSTIEYKFYVRNQDNRHLTAAPKGDYNLSVVDPMGKKVLTVASIQLNDFGSYAGELDLPDNAAVGWYTFYLTSNFSPKQWVPLRVLVSDFTPSPFRVSADLNGELFTIGSSVQVDAHARLHAGGPFTQAENRITATLRVTPLRPDHPRTKGFHFDVQSLNSTNSMVVHQSSGSLNMQGDLHQQFTIPASNILYGRLEVENAVRDERGKYVAGRSSAKYVGRDRFVGIKQGDWLLQAGKAASVEAMVVDAYGAPVEGHDIYTRIEQRITKAARVKGSGNAYVTQYSHSWQPVHSCSLASRSQGKAATCAFTPAATGYYRISSLIKDTLGRSHQSVLHRWALGEGEVVWEMPEGHELQITPEKKSYKVGEKARYLVQNPYPGARALITLERFGVIKKWVKVLHQQTEVIEFPIKADYLPGFYLSVVIASPRVKQPLGEGKVDLGKPAFRMGYVEVAVVDLAKQIQLDVRPERALYKPGETVKVNIHAQAPRGKKVPMELAIAVLDESVFDLLSGGSKNFDPYRGFYKLEPLDLENFNLLKMLVGRQKFEAKGANAGGDGGSDLNLRSLFKFVSYWNPSLKTDAQGKAEISFKLPDNLTGWRVLVMAVDQADQMGLGQANFKVNQSTELRAALPNHVIEKDQFNARFSVMNRTNSRRLIHLKVHAAGPVLGIAEISKDLYVEPFKREYIELPITASAHGEIILTARAGDALDSDTIRVRLPVHKLKALETAATYGTSTHAELRESITFPKNMREDMGSVSVVASPSVISGIESAFAYMRDYPYACWEQRLSKGVMASHYVNLRQYMKEDFKWDASESLPQKTLNQAASFQADNGGMVYYIASDRHVSPYLSAYTALAFNWLKKSGYKVPVQVENRLHDYLKTMLRQQVLPSFYSAGMSSTVRAVALAALAPHGKISIADLHRYKSHLGHMSLFGKAHYLQAATALAAPLELQKEVVDTIRAHANETGGKFIFSEQLDSRFERILATSLRSNCAVLSALLAYEQATKADSATPFKLVRTIRQSRKRGGYWQNTQENMFCMNALTDFSREYEQVAPNFTLQASMDKQPMGKTATFDDVKDAPVNFERAIKAGDAGRTSSVLLKKNGEGRYYYATRLTFSPKVLKKKGINAGMEAHREYYVQRESQWKRLISPMQIHRGELVRVDIFLSLPSARNFVVVNDPVPGGLEPVNRDLATASTVDANQAGGLYEQDSYWFNFQDWRSFNDAHWSFYHKELRHDSVRFYSEYLPAGNYHLSYTAQAIATGAFTVPPLHSEEMYDPDVFAQGAPALLKVGEL